METKTKTAAKKSAEKKTEKKTDDRVRVRILQTGEFYTGSTTFTLARGATALLPRKTAEEKAKTKAVEIIG